MKRFPSNFRNGAQVAGLLYYATVWGGGRKPEVMVKGLDSLRMHVNEITRTPSGGRVEKLARYVNTIHGMGRAGVPVPPDTATRLFEACLAESGALLELGCPRDEPVVFTASFPSPAANSIRTENQVRSALHHVGGDFELFRAMMRTGSFPDASLEFSVSPWPPPVIPEESFILRLGFPGQAVPAVMLLRRRLLGYILLCCWDMAVRLRDRENVSLLYPDFASFVSDFMESGKEN